MGLTTNTSPTKQRFSFPKSSRFRSHKANQVFTSVAHSVFDGPKRQLGGSFGVSSERFNYTRIKEKGPFGHVSPISRNEVGQSFTFGTSRSTSKKFHVDKIFRDFELGLESPSAQQYNTLHYQKNKGVSYKIAQRYYEFDRELKVAEKLPGPGSYASMCLTGQRSTNSLYQSQATTKFGKGPRHIERKGETDEVQTSFSIKFPTSFVFKREPSAVFGQDPRSNKTFLAGLKDDVPGPGRYTIPSEFSDLT